MVRPSPEPQPSTLVIFGASGDLTGRYILPSLAQLHASGELPEDFSILGLARDEWTEEQFKAHVAKQLDRHGSSTPRRSREAIVRMAGYRQVDVTAAGDVKAAVQSLAGPFIAYLALPPFLFEPAIQALLKAEIPTGSRIIVEKPFGHDRASARRLNDIIHGCFPEGAIFRIDHFLALETVQNILGLRFANRLFEPIWNATHVERVEIVWDETLTVEGRASYDQVGALRDVVQNHLLQVLTLVAMDPAATLGEADLRGRKFDVLRAVKTPTAEEIRRNTVRGRYTAGRIGRRKAPNYVDEPGIDGTRGTETFASLVLYIDNWRWAGVPFVLRTGKALGKDRQEVAVHLRPVPHLEFWGRSRPEQNHLRFALDTNRMSLGINTTVPAEDFSLTTLELAGDLAPSHHSAYGQLLVNAMAGDPALFIRDDEAEESWRIMDPILGVWADGGVSLLEYPAGSSGPADH